MEELMLRLKIPLQVRKRMFLDKVSNYFASNQPTNLMDRGFDRKILLGMKNLLNTGFRFHLLNLKDSNNLQDINSLIQSAQYSDSNNQDHKIDIVIHHRVSHKVRMFLLDTLE